MNGVYSLLSITAAMRGNNPRLKPSDLGLPDDFHDLLAEAINTRDWFRIMLLAGSEGRPPALEVLWPYLNDNEKPELMVEATSGGDWPSRVAGFLCSAVDELIDLGQLAFDGDDARRRYNELPNLIVVYRGTVQAEVDGGLNGICWTLNPAKAVWFATLHGRFRNTHSAAVIVQATISKCDVAGLMVERDEDEVLLNPERLTNVIVEPAADRKEGAS